MTLQGFAHKYGDNVDTDVIIPARYLNTSDEQELAAHCLEDLDADFIHRVKPGDMIVAGDNFGCGSSREHAPVAIKAAGVSCVIAKRFARIFFRNAINIGLPVLISKEASDAVQAGDELQADLSAGKVADLTRGESYQAEPFPQFLQELIGAGGLVAYTKSRLG